MKPITARAPQAASAGVPLVLIQDARARKVNGDVIVRRRPRRTDECGFDHRRGMRAIVDLGPCAMALRVNLGRRYGVKRRADPKGGELTGRAHQACSPIGGYGAARTGAHRPRRRPLAWQVMATTISAGP